MAVAAYGNEFLVGLTLSVTDAGSGSVAVGSTLPLTVTATNDGDVDDVTAQATYVSSDASKATVDEAGVVTGVAAGSATITASFGGKSATHPVTVA